MHKRFKWIGAVVLALCLPLIQQPVLANDALNADIATLQHEWANITYQTPENAQEAAFEQLVKRAHEVSEKHQQAPEALIWEAITQAGYAKAKGGLGGLNFAKSARELLLVAKDKNPEALQGSAYTSLGSLFYKVPGWPIGFGNHDKAREYLNKALAINPNGIDPNYFYADFLLEEGDYATAVEYFEKALAAPARVGREDADTGRKAEIKAGLAKAKSKL